MEEHQELDDLTIVRRELPVQIAHQLVAEKSLSSARQPNQDDDKLLLVYTEATAALPLGD